MSIINGPLNNNEARAGFNYVARFSAAEINDQLGEDIPLWQIPAKGGLELAFALHDGTTHTGDLIIEMGLASNPALDDFINFDFGSGTTGIVYNSGALLFQFPAGPSIVLGGAHPVAADPDADQFINVRFQGTGPVEGGDILLGALITDPFRFFEVQPV